MRHLIICGLVIISSFSCQEDFDCSSKYFLQGEESLHGIHLSDLLQGHGEINGAYTDASFTFSSHCYEEIEELLEWLEYPPGHEPTINQVGSLWHLDGVTAFIPSDTSHLKWWHENLLYRGSVTDCQLEEWRFEDIYDYSNYPAVYLDTIKAIAHHNRLSSSQRGYGDAGLRIFRRTSWLINHLSTPELLSLVNFPNPTVKAVAFEGLYRRKHPNLFQILLHFLTLEQDYISYSSGCISWRLHLSQYCFSYIMKYYPNNGPALPPSSFDYEALTTSEQAMILKELEKYGSYW